MVKVRKKFILTSVEKDDDEIRFFIVSFLLIGVVLLLLFFFIRRSNLGQSRNKLHIFGVQTQIENPWHSGQEVIFSPPVRLTIPKIGVDAFVEHVGVTADGKMETPSNAIDVGWFEWGPIPGEKGSAVVSGHLNGLNGELGVFANLSSLESGDKIYVEDEGGVKTGFIIRSIQTYDPGYADEVFSSNNGTHLNLVTCDGVWDEATKSYSKRLVVFATIAD